MRRDRPFRFSFAISKEFIRHAPAVADEYIEAQQREIAERVIVYGPRGGAYKLYTPPDKWESSEQYGYDWDRNLKRWSTRRMGRYIRPSQVPFADSITFRTFTIPVVDGVATLPDGRRVESTAHYVDVPVVPGGVR